MKKIMAILMVIAATSAFANGHESKGDKGNRGHQKGNEKMEQMLEGLTEAQKEELMTMKEQQRKDREEVRLEIKSVDLEMEKELLEDSPNKEVIKDLIDKKSDIRTNMQKDMIEHKFEMKEKFGRDMKMGKGHEGNSKRKGRSEKK